ncbi:hypothetical protein Y032_0343g3063 [Ancylostoma ceylanicum]|uniref:Uncharacterized protein n=1 Tax=Ancylostoma ceylanicum TaxID=53326 RepID=A0A016RXM9_9BILA|nr:hypothetical protein Y032_0343g3063 [Ancylostoma ceylanicum]
MPTWTLSYRTELDGFIPGYSLISRQLSTDRITLGRCTAAWLETLPKLKKYQAFVIFSELNTISTMPA